MRILQQGRSGAAIKEPFKVHEVRALTDSTYVLRFDRHGLDFRTGQYLWVGDKKKRAVREYSIYSAEQDEFLEVLIREVADGEVSRRLKKLKAGDELNVSGPYGYFTFSDEEAKDSEFLFIATGTGISPFHSYISTFPELNYKLVHGIRQGEERYEIESYGENYTACVSQEKVLGTYAGRVTDWLRQQDISPDTRCFICGNYQMIQEVFDILKEKGFAANQMHAEVYF